MTALRIALLVALPVVAVAHRERIVLAVELEEGRCSLRLEADDEARALRLRVTPESARCEVSRDAFGGILRDGFERIAPPQPEGAYTSLYVGRLVALPWLASHLASTAAADARWDRRRGRPVEGDLNRYVGALLSRREVTDQLDSAIQGSGYRIARATVEKVLVGGLRDVPGHEGPSPPGKVPYDAQVWFTLERRPPGSEGDGRDGGGRR